MPTVGGGSMSLVIISLGILGIILSFLVPDRKKSLISLVLAGLIILVGLVQYGSQTFRERRMKRAFNTLQRDRQVDLDKLREEFRKKTAEPAPGQTKKKP